VVGVVGTPLNAAVVDVDNEDVGSGTDTERVSALEAVQNIAEFANAVASLVVGHRKILVEGGFDPNMSDQMAAALHASLLGLSELWDFDSMDTWPDIEDEDEDDSDD